MQATSELADFMREHKIEVQFRADDPAVQVSEGWEHRAYRFSLTVNGTWLLGNAPYRAGMGIDKTTAEDIFGSVLMDCQSVECYDTNDPDTDWADWAESLGLLNDAASVRKALADYREIRARASLLREALGEDAFKRALDIASEL